MYTGMLSVKCLVFVRKCQNVILKNYFMFYFCPSKVADRLPEDHNLLQIILTRDCSSIFFVMINPGYTSSIFLSWLCQ